jgi:ketosteroid isomerase-like protein
MTQEQDFLKFLQRYEEAAGRFGTGDAEPVKAFFARGDDVTLLSGVGGYFRGWENVSSHLDRAASQFSGTKEHAWEYEPIHTGVDGDLAYAVVIEGEKGVDVARGDSSVTRQLRATLIFRRQNGEWKLVHRHADPLASERSAAELFRGKLDSPDVVPAG